VAALAQTSLAIESAPEPGPGERVLVGLSGGVDSALTAWLLRERGCEAIGVTIKNFCFGEPPFESLQSGGSCCDADAIEAARELCAQLAMPHRVLDSSQAFGREVIADWSREYRSGRTPSPCVRCNSRVRFPALLQLADELAAPWVATGHYARRARVGSECFVGQAADGAKDQSYFLYRLPSQALRRIAFPLGSWEKSAVRAAAHSAKLAVASRPDSQELCFVPDGDRRPLLGAQAQAGSFVDADGVELGRHAGIEFFTVGQRRGIGIAAAQPLHVLRIEPETARIVLGPAGDLDVHRIVCQDVLWRDPLDGAPGLIARSRYRHAGTPVAQLQRQNDRLELRLAAPDRAVAPGQALVLFRQGLAVGGGSIVSASKEE
jgi:tRNA-specific 2-thiouridylase